MCENSKNNFRSKVLGCFFVGLICVFGILTSCKLAVEGEGDASKRDFKNVPSKSEPPKTTASLSGEITPVFLGGELNTDQSLGRNFSCGNHQVELISYEKGVLTLKCLSLSDKDITFSWDGAKFNKFRGFWNIASSAYGSYPLSDEAKAQFTIHGTLTKSKISCTAPATCSADLCDKDLSSNGLGGIYHFSEGFKNVKDFCEKVTQAQHVQPPLDPAHMKFCEPVTCTIPDPKFDEITIHLKVLVQTNG